jgi:hypothetical protein
MDHMKSVEIAVMTPAREAEGMMDEVFSQAAPKGRFTKSVMNALASAYRDAQKAMGFPEQEMYPDFDADVTEFPAEFVRGLAMLASAAEDYGKPGLIELDGIAADEDVARLAATIQSLMADKEFIAFLGSPMDEMGETTYEDTDEEKSPEGDEMEEMFSSRA